MPAETSSGGAFDFEQCRSYLRLLAELQIDAQLQGKVDLSGVIQQTMLDANNAGNVPGDSAARLAWLRRVLANNLTDEVRKAGRGRRDARREVSIDAAIELSSCRLMAFLDAEQPTPSRIVEASEQAVELARALDRLPEAQRQALVLQHWHGWTLQQIAEHMGKTRVAVAGLLKRGLQQLRQAMRAEPDC